MTLAIPDDRRMFEELVPGGAMWSWVLRRHEVLRLTDVEGGANVSMLLYNRDLLLERYNMPDTLKAQHTAFVTRGHVCYSDMGRVLCSITEDTAGWNDTVCGVSDDAMLRERFGVKRFQEQRNAMHRSAKEGLLKEIGRWGLGKRDLHANLNFFSKVTADEAGELTYHPGFSPAGAHIDLRCEMEVLIALSSSVHPLDLRSEYSPRPVKLSAWRSGPVPQNDACRTRCPENQRGFINTERYFAR